MDLDQQKRFLVRFAYFALILGIAIFVCRWVLPKLLPFFIALAISLLLKPVVRFLYEKCRIKRSVAGAVIVILFYAVIGLLITVLTIKLISSARSFVMNLPALYAERIEPFLYDAFDAVERFVSRLDPSAAAAYDVIAPRVVEELEGMIAALSKTLLSVITDTAIAVPGVLLDALIAIIATVFIAIDWTTIKEFVLRQCPDRTKRLLLDIRTHLSATLWKYTKSYALILFITFVELAVGLSIVGVERAMQISLLIAVFDILPVVGSGMVLFPWTLVTLLSGNYLRALGLGVVYLTVVVVRNIIEPRIVGNRVGLHPIVTLAGMVVGTYVFGPIGLLALPVTLALIQSLNEQGVIHLYKRKTAVPPTEPPETGDNGAGTPDEPNGTGESFGIADEPADE